MPKTRIDPDPIIFSKPALFQSLEYIPHSGQIEVHKSEAMRRVVACGVRWGKTLCAAMEGIAAAMHPRQSSIGWICAPTYDLADKVFREIEMIALEKLKHRLMVHKSAERRIILRNMAGGPSEIRGKSADNPVSLLGEGLDWLIIDEAARLKPRIWENHLSQRLIDKMGWALLISTPAGKGYFHDLYRRGQNAEDPQYASWNNPTWTNPHINSELIDKERERLPERVFAQEYAAKFIEGSGQVFRNVRECATGSFEKPNETERYYGGLDLARVEDYTVFTIMTRDRRVVYVDRFHRIDWGMQVERIKKVSDDYRKPKIMVDCTGVGDPIYEALRKSGCFVSPYPFTLKSKNALIDNLAMMIERKEITLPTAHVWPDGIDELESFQYSVTDQGNVRTGAPSGYHDDIVISLALAAWQVRTNRAKPGMVFLEGSI